MLPSADDQPVGQGTKGPLNYLSAGQDFISLCVYYDLYDIHMTLLWEPWT